MRTYKKRKKRHYGCLFVAAFFLLLFFLQGQGEALKKTSSATVMPREDVVHQEKTEGSETNITLYRTATGVSKEMPLETYILGVVAAEVPPSFEAEAIKAQAIVARTYALSTLSQGGALCDDYRHCQGYYDADTRHQRWGADYQRNEEKYASAVAETKGLAVTYEGNLAKTFFHSTCGGSTSSAKEVWGSEIPYLQSVACDWDKDAPRYEETVSFSKSEMAQRLSEADDAALPVFAGFTPSGRVATLSYGGKTIKATDFRQCLALNSTNFSLRESGDTVWITTKGYGHGVGLCQYGANGMAKEGKTAEENICHYYTDVKVVPYP